jgi:diguanylate cyclase (GGDEF)-like protein/PAS domain S-box-containing protein
MRSITEILRQIGLGGKAGSSASPLEPNFRLLAEHSSDIVVEVGADRKTAYVSPSCTRLLGWLPEDLIGRGPEAFILPEYIPAVEADIAAFDGGTQDEGTLVMQLRKKDGNSLWVEGKARMVRGEEIGAAGEIVAVFRDISERKKLEDELARAALTDGLTGIANRRAFDETLDREWSHTLLTGGRMSLLLIDIDRFKDFNDTYGHQAGDDCLRVIALSVRNALHYPAGMVARYGGEEFTVVLRDTDIQGAIEVAERLRRAALDAGIPHHKNMEGGGRVTVSIGAATALSRAGGTIRMPEGLLLAADSALYKAKHLGRNRVESALLLTPDNSAAA